MRAASCANEVGFRLAQSPLRHPFLVARTERHVRGVLVGPAKAPVAPPPLPHGHHPDGPEARAWAAFNLTIEDARRRAAEGRAADPRARAAMVRWLEGVGRLEAVVRDAEAAGLTLTVTGRALDELERADLRGLRAEMNGYRALCLEVEAQELAVKAADGCFPEVVAREKTTLSRLVEMRDHHKAKARFLWVRSFHFDPDAQAEAERLAPRLIAVIRREIEPEVAEQSGGAGEFLNAQGEPFQEAVAEMARATLEAVEGNAGKAASSTARGAATRAAKAVRRVGAAMAAVKSAFPAMARKVLQMVALVEKTPLERLASSLPDWRLDGLAVADRRLRACADRAAQVSTRHTMVGYAKAIADDPALMGSIRAEAPAIAGWIERTAGKDGGGKPKVEGPEQRRAQEAAPPAPQARQEEPEEAVAGPGMR